MKIFSYIGVFLAGMLLAMGLSVYAATAPLKQALTPNGMNQGDLWQAIENLTNVVNELQTDHATFKAAVDATETMIEELADDHATARTELIAIGTTLADYKAIYDAHTHEAPGSSYAASRTSTPDTGAAENSLAASAASAFTDTSGSSVPATLTATDPPSGPATLTESTAVDLTP